LINVRFEFLLFAHSDKSLAAGVNIVSENRLVSFDCGAAGLFAYQPRGMDQECDNPRLAADNCAYR